MVKISIRGLSFEYNGSKILDDLALDVEEVTEVLVRLHLGEFALKDFCELSGG